MVSDIFYLGHNQIHSIFVQPRLRDIHFWMLMMRTWVANPEITIFIKTEPLSQLCSCPSERPAIRTDISFGIWVGGMHLIFEKKRKPVNVLPRCVITSRPPSDTNRQGGRRPRKANLRIQSHPLLSIMLIGPWWGDRSNRTTQKQAHTPTWSISMDGFESRENNAGVNSIVHKDDFRNFY